MDKSQFNFLREGYGVMYGRGNSQISFLVAVTNFLDIFNMSATIARQESWVQLEQSDILLALNMAKITNGGLPHTTIEQMQYLIKKTSRQRTRREVTGS